MQVLIRKKCTEYSFGVFKVVLCYTFEGGMLKNGVLSSFLGTGFKHPKYEVLK